MLGYPWTGIFDPQAYAIALLAGRKANHRIGTAVANGVFGQVENRAVYEGVAADHHRSAVVYEGDSLALGKRGEVGTDLLEQRGQLDCVVAGNRTKLAHFKQGFRHLRHAPGLLLQKLEKLGHLEGGIGVLDLIQLHLRLHQRKRRAQLVRGVARELPLRCKTLVKAGDHVVERGAELLELRQHVLGDLHLGQVVWLHLFNLRGEIPQRPKRSACHKIRKHTAKQRHRHRYKPIRRTKRLLGVAHDNHEVIVVVLGVEVEGTGIALLGIGVGRYVIADRIHVVLAGVADQKVHQYAGQADEQRRHQRDAPLQGQLFHAPASIT